MDHKKSASTILKEAAGETTDSGWIDVPVCELILARALVFVVPVDGSEQAMAGFTLLTEDIMQRNRNTSVEVMHVYNRHKDYLPPAMKEEALRSVYETLLTSSLSAKRYKLYWTPQNGEKVSAHVINRVAATAADFAVIGFSGRKGPKGKRDMLASNCSEILARAGCGVIVMKDCDPQQLPIRRATKFVVSVSLNKASTKAFLDALRLSNPNDEIYVVYVKSFMERADSDYTAEVREKYSGFFAALKDGESDVFSKFHDRKCEFLIIDKQRRETTSGAVVRFAEEVEADFVSVGTNSLRISRGKPPIGTVSMDICLQWHKNFIVSHWVDVGSTVYDKHCRPMSQQ
jgi:hypothetical protein